MQLCAQKAWLAISAFSPSVPVRALAVSLFDPSGHRWAMLASPGAGQDGPLLVAKLALLWFCYEVLLWFFFGRHSW